jgi:hypothetical protein
VTDLINAGQFSTNPCLKSTETLVNNENASQRSRVFITALLAVLWISTAVGVAFSAYAVWYFVQKVVCARRAFDLAHQDLLADLSRPGCHREKLIRLAHIIGEDVLQIACTVLISIYITGWSNLTVLKIAVSSMNMGMALSRIFTSWMPWHWTEGRMAPKSHGRLRGCVWGFGIAVVAAGLTSPLWIVYSTYVNTASLAHDAQYSPGSGGTSAVSDYLDASFGMQESIPVAYALTARACITQSPSNVTVCTPSWTSYMSQGLLGNAKPWDVHTYQVLYNQAAWWTNYTTPLPTNAQQGYLAPTAREVFIVAFRRRLRNWQVRALEASGGQSGPRRQHRWRRTIPSLPVIPPILPPRRRLPRR